MISHDGSGLHIAIVHARWNSTVVDSLVSGCVDALIKQNVKKENLTIYSVPGSYELQFATKSLIATAQDTNTRLDCVVSIGVLIKGSTMHFEYICDTVSHGLSQVGLDTGVPVIFGVLTCLTEQQALQRAGIGENSHNHGIDWAHAAVEMVKFKFDHTKLMKK